MVQWLRLCAFTAGGMSSITGWGTKIPHATQRGPKKQNKTKKQKSKNKTKKLAFKKIDFGASLVAQWLRIRLPVQGTRVRFLVRKDPTCRGADESVRHNY